MNDSLFPDLPEMSEPVGGSTRKWLPYILIAAGVLFLLVIPLLFLGEKEGTGTSGSVAVDPLEVARLEQQQLLDDLIESIQPERIGQDVDETTIAQELNRWWIQYGPGLDGNPDFGAAHREPLQLLLGEDASDLALDNDFGRRDVAHLATALTFRLAGLMITTGLSSDVEKVSESFYFLMRNIQIEPPGTKFSAVFPYQTLLWGRGRAADRVWAFVELLRQIRIDSFVVLPVGDDGVPPLVAVNVGDELLLYDPILGLPIPTLSTTDDSTLPMLPASFTEALANDAVFRQLDGADSPYPWTSTMLRDVRLLVVGTDSTFSPRMEALQTVLPGQFSFLVFDGWSESQFRPDADPLQVRLESIAAGLNGVNATLGVWNYPLSQAAAYDVENGLDGEYLTEREGWLLAPTLKEVQTDANGNVREVQKTSSRPLLLIRSLHMVGDFEQAMSGYLPMRNSYRQNQVPENRNAAELAVFWSACCQFELERPDLSISGFRDYLRDHSSAQFATTASYWLAVSLAETRDMAAALEALKSPGLASLPPGLIAYLEQRWSQSVDVSDDASSPAPVDEDAESEEADENASPPAASAAGDDL